MSSARAAFFYGVKLIDGKAMDFRQIVEEDEFDADPEDCSEVIEEAGGFLIVEDLCGGLGQYLALRETLQRTPEYGSRRLEMPAVRDDGRRLALKALLLVLDLEEHVDGDPGWFLVCEYEGT